MWSCCQSEATRHLRQVSHQIDAQLRVEREASKHEVKLLLLGAGESGKSTIQKQMRLIHGSGFSEAERVQFRHLIYGNLVRAMRILLEAMALLTIPLGDPEAQEEHVTCVRGVSMPGIQLEDLPGPLARALRTLWQDAGVQVAVSRSSEYQLPDSTSYFYAALDRISAPGYVPTDQDILRARTQTSGIVESRFRVGDFTYRLFDVGGQRSERKKWISCFENVACIVFMVAISEYDQKLVEDPSVSRLREAMTLFESICKSRWFRETSIVLFLNKVDLFQAKLKHVPLREYFPDFEGPCTDERAAEFLLTQFLALNKSEQKQIYAHFTCATDTEQVRFVMAAVSDIILQTNLRSLGFL